jgi:hypothetical protein
MKAVQYETGIPGLAVNCHIPEDRNARFHRHKIHNPQHEYTFPLDHVTVSIFFPDNLIGITTETSSFCETTLESPEKE